MSRVKAGKEAWSPCRHRRSQHVSQSAHAEPIRVNLYRALAAQSRGRVHYAIAV
jgi:hypothetical protein